jgi:hypothetical protein
MSEEGGGHSWTYLLLTVATIGAAGFGMAIVGGFGSMNGGGSTPNSTTPGENLILGYSTSVNSVTFTLSGVPASDSVYIGPLTGQAYCTGTGDVSCVAPITQANFPTCPFQVQARDLTTGALSNILSVKANC